MKFLREPLIHFLLLGAAIFVIYGLVSEDRGRKPGHIVVTQGKIENLVATFAETFLLAHQFENVSATDVQKAFGDTFLAGLSALTPGQGQGPVPSGYGVHLVYVSERTAARIAELTDVRDVVRREWANARRVKANETFYQSLLQRHTVTIERPQPADGEKNVAEVRR